MLLTGLPAVEAIYNAHPCSDGRCSLCPPSAENMDLEGHKGIKTGQEVRGTRQRETKSPS
jgi:hypothetical protein